MQNGSSILGGKAASATGETMQDDTAKLQGSEMNWDDIRYVEALHREGTIAAVAIIKWVRDISLQTKCL
jgi:hypothetical protein